MMGQAVNMAEMIGSHLEVSIIVFTLCLASSASSPACSQAGGLCVNRYEGCNNGDFVEGLCKGPNYYQCCVMPPVIDEEALNRPKWRMCHECSYSVSKDRELGDKDCYTWENKGENLSTANCTGMCSKEHLKLDQDSFEIVRKCSKDCHQDKSNPMLNIDCCWGNLCNLAPSHIGGSTAPWILTIGIHTMLLLWRNL